MKKLVLVVFLFVGYVNAQTVQFGAKAGVNFASLGGDETEDLDGRTGFHLGVLAEIPVTGNFAFQPEVLYSSVGAKSEMSEVYMDLAYSSKEELTLDYISVPLMAKYTVFPGLSLQAGPQIGFLVKAEDKYEISMNGENESGTEDIKDSMKDIEFALAAGLSYQLPIGVFFNARYTAGLSDIVDDDGDEDYSLHNNVFQLSVGYMF